MDKINTKDINQLTHKIIGCAMEVHRFLGNGFTHLINLFFNGVRECFAIQEVVYQRALSLINFVGKSLDLKRVYNKNLVNPKGM